MDNKKYRTECRTDSDYDDIPVAVEFEINQDAAEEIVRLSKLVATNGLFKVEKFDYSASYYNGDENGDASDETARTDSDCLNVSETEFWFSAYLKHTDVEVLSERQRIQELASYFGLDLNGRNLKWYAVTGRIPGDDEDTSLIFHVESREAALEAFANAMWADEKEDDREAVIREHGQPVFWNSIAVSDSPIEAI